MLDSGAEGPGFKSQPRRCQVTVLGKLFTPIVFDLVYFYFSDRSGYTHTQLIVSGKDVAKC